MKKKKILFAIHALGAGGAEKSLVSLLNAIPIDNYEVDLMVNKPNGIFRYQVPKSVHVFEAPKEVICQGEQIFKLNFWKHATLRILILKILCIIGCYIRSNNNKNRMSHDQYYNEFWRKHYPDLNKHYDIAISYMDGVNYYIIDHVFAIKKILWCHNDYNKLDYKPLYDYKYFNKADIVCTISEICKKSLIENFPLLKNKFEVVENISSARMIEMQANNLEEIKKLKDGFREDKRCKIVSIGRLTEQKGFDFAIDAAKILKEKGFKFCWYILGEGPLRKSLETQIKLNGVSDYIRLLGIRSNPYPYIKYADIFVMPSRYEGKSIALDEAKVLCKPIVVTNYPSVNDAIIDGQNGMIVDIDAESIAKGILALYNDDILKSFFVNNLKIEDNSNEHRVVEKFLSLIK